ncbi:bifunctional 4'-phosphopantothenoylcysteine decarboxylase/phosphopantothenoylcysteine synthetase [candidate division LCP-89 bacterium B3_LCP]|uniref:Coenzyme A biosynthesis bifunctional protein CoaBC n=1 Tax=candidate division LCP-89 bacterium B3_LCP TaxID=2012998 RepID=A0A532V155_UNCL8|nr:MAG: bifunctional 4'-phosphopantothenoylcysteine decarboxylase/phosphopantothenoylcysteine synthetase [candidate division LCP-89 bacterium B3_LCP]
MLSNRKILVAVTGGIAAYKTCELVRHLIRNGADVRVSMTQSAAKFLTPLTFEALTGKKVLSDMFASEEGGSPHLDCVRDIDLMVIAPATANCIGKIAHGIADDLLSTSVLALSAPLLLCPAMNPKMYQNKAVVDNLNILNNRGVLIMEPEEGSMASPDEEPGIGRLPDPARILDRICRILPPDGSLSGYTITVTAGPTEEAIDPVRVVSNLSSGRMGFAIAERARQRGADVRLVAGPAHLHTPIGLDVERVKSTADMRDAVLKNLEESQVLIMAAAPCDYAPKDPKSQKIKKKNLGGNLNLELVETSDILKEASDQKGERIFVGFALETENELDNARRKLADKNLDIIVLNSPDAGSGVGLGENSIQGTILYPNEKSDSLPSMSKIDFADALLDRIGQLLGRD